MRFTTLTPTGLQKSAEEVASSAFAEAKSALIEAADVIQREEGAIVEDVKHAFTPDSEKVPGVTMFRRSSWHANL